MDYDPPSFIEFPVLFPNEHNHRDNQYNSPQNNVAICLPRAGGRFRFMELDKGGAVEKRN